MNSCPECGMPLLTEDEYHPRAACLAYKAGVPAEQVRENMRALRGGDEQV